MNGVVFQISDRQMTNSAEPRSPNQSRDGSNQLLMKPRVDGEGVLPGVGRDHRDDGVGHEDRGADDAAPERSALCITIANAKPRTSSTATVMTVISSVVPKSVHQTLSERIIA